MGHRNQNTYDLYRDISERTGGEIYLGVVGPVRTGKSTFIKRFMDLMVLPQIQDVHQKERTIDELPQSAQGKTIMTTEPKFIPKEAVEIKFDEDIPVKVRLVDCVGFLIDGVSGHLENGSERMVKTPWMEEEMPFAQAARIGTEKVIKDHATIGIVVTTDGSFTELPRGNYVEAEERAVKELQKIGKPFILLLNTTKPYGAEATTLAEELEGKYGVKVLPVNCEQLRKDDILQIINSVLYEFPVERMEFYMPKWVEMLEDEHPLKKRMIRIAKKMMEEMDSLRDVSGSRDFGRFWKKEDEDADEDDIKDLRMEHLNLADGCIRFRFEISEKLYYENISQLAGIPINGEYQLIAMIRDLSEMKKEYSKVSEAIASVKGTGYGVVEPTLEEISMEEPELIRHGNKYGVKIKASSPSIHMIRANVETEIAPIIGDEKQAQDLIDYIKENQSREAGMWETNIFGKSVGELISDGINRKITMMDEDSQVKLQDTMQKIVNDSNGGMVCIII